MQTRISAPVCEQEKRELIHNNYTDVDALSEGKS